MAKPWKRQGRSFWNWVFKENDRYFGDAFYRVGWIPTLGLGVIIPVAVIATNHSTHVNCLKTHELTGQETVVKGSFWNETCYVKTSKGHWVEVDKYNGWVE